MYRTKNCGTLLQQRHALHIHRITCYKLTMKLLPNTQTSKHNNETKKCNTYSDPENINNSLSRTLNPEIALALLRQILNLSVLKWLVTFIVEIVK